MRTDKYYFDGLNEGEFKELQKAAWDGILDYSEFPACEYKFFDAVRIAGYRHRHEKRPMDFCRADIAQAKRVYSRETEERRYSLEIHGKYQDAILKTDALRCQLTKSQRAWRKAENRAYNCGKTYRRGRTGTKGDGKMKAVACTEYGCIANLKGECCTDECKGAIIRLQPCRSNDRELRRKVYKISMDMFEEEYSGK